MEFAISFRAGSGSGVWSQVAAVFLCFMLMFYLWEIRKRIEAAIHAYREEDTESEDVIDVDAARLLSMFCCVCILFFAGFGASVLWGLGDALLR